MKTMLYVYNLIRRFQLYYIPIVMILALIWMIRIQDLSPLPWLLILCVLQFLLGLGVQVSKNILDAQYAKAGGQLIVNSSNPLEDTYQLELEASLEDLAQLKHFRIDVVQH